MNQADTHKKRDRKLARKTHRAELSQGYAARAREMIYMLRKQEHPADVVRAELRKLRHQFTRTIKTLSAQP